MIRFRGVERPHQPDWQGFIDTIMRRGTPPRVFHVELYQDTEIRDAIAERYRLTDRLDPRDPWH